MNDFQCLSVVHTRKEVYTKCIKLALLQLKSKFNILIGYKHMCKILITDIHKMFT